MALSLDQALKEAACAIDNKNKLRARRIYEKIIQGFPDNTEAMEGLKKLSQDGTNVNPHPALMESIGKLMREDKHDLAIEELEELIKEFPKSANLQSMKGTCHARLKQGRLASSSFNKALEINSRFFSFLRSDNLYCSAAFNFTCAPFSFKLAAILVAKNLEFPVSLT